MNRTLDVATSVGAWTYAARAAGLDQSLAGNIAMAGLLLLKSGAMTAGRLWGSLPTVETHQRPVTPASGSVALQEVRPSPEPLLAAQRLSSVGRGLLRGHGSDSEALTPFSAPPIDDGSTLPGPHPKTKAVGAFPTAIVRLVGSLHGDAAFSESTVFVVQGSGLQRKWVAALTPITLKNAIPYWIPASWSRVRRPLPGESGSRGRLPALSSHTTVRTVPYTAVHERH